MPDAPTVLESPPSALEQRVAALWHGVLSRPAERSDDFFALGGDSLMATRMVAQLNQSGIGHARLQDLFTHSTLADFCRCITPPEKDAVDNPIALAHTPGQTTFFVFHASDGEVSALLPLARHLRGQTFGLQAVKPQRHASLSALAEEYVHAIQRTQPQGPYTLVGWSYGTFLAAEAAYILHHQGHAARLVLIDPVCQCDFHCQDRTALFALFSQNHKALSLPDTQDQLSEEERTRWFLKRCSDAGLLPPHTQSDAAHDWLDRVQHLLMLLAQHVHREPLPVPCQILRASRHPDRWTPAHQTWQAWMDNAACHEINADHWQLMLEASCAKQCAHHIHTWLTQLPETMS